MKNLPTLLITRTHLISVCIFSILLLCSMGQMKGQIVVIDDVIALPASSQGNSQADVEVYPNPASQYVYVQFNEPVPQGVIELLSLEGGEKYTVQLTQSYQPNTQIKLDVGSLPRKTYVLKVNTAKGPRTSKIVLY